MEMACAHGARGAKLRSLWVQCRSATAGLGEEVQYDKPRAHISNSCTEQHSPVSPPGNIWMLLNFGFLKPWLKPTTGMCPPQHHNTELLSTGSIPGREHSKSWPVFPWHWARSPQQSPCAGLGPEAGTPRPSPHNAPPAEQDCSPWATPESSTATQRWLVPGWGSLAHCI